MLTDTRRGKNGRLCPAAYTAVNRTLDKIKALIAAEETGQEVRIEAGRQRLEALFLDIVKQAQDDDVQTSGAAPGGPLAEFLVSGAAAADGSKNDDG